MMIDTTSKRWRLSSAIGWALASLIILFHIAMMMNAQSRLSPTWDEIAYPAAGLVQLKTGDLSLNVVNPFLSKLFFSAPLLALNPPLPFSDSSWVNKDEYRFGFVFTFRNHASAQKLIALSRLPAVIFSVFTGLLLFFLGRWCWGEMGGLLTLVGYTTTPIFLSRASVAQLEMPVYFFIVLSLWCHILWFKNGKYRYLIFSGVALGLSLVGKFIGLPFLLALLVINFFNPRKLGWRARLGAGLVLVLTVSLTISLATLPWHGGWTALQQMGVNLLRFDKILPFYWRGHFYSNANSLLTWEAFLIKAPLHILILGVAGAAVWIKSGKVRIVLVHYMALSLSSLLAVLFFKNAVSTVQLSPAYIGLVGMMGVLGGYRFRHHKTGIVFLGGLLIMGSADVFAVHPNYLAYFNFLSGGPKQGWRWLGDSDQDWGQGLPLLAEYLKRNNSSDVILCYSGSADPVAYGIRYQDLLSSALVTRDMNDSITNPNSDRLVLAVATKILQIEPAFAWLLQNRTPIDQPNACFFVYDVGQDRDILKWMGEIYQQTNRPIHAAWTAERYRYLSERNAPH